MQASECTSHRQASPNPIRRPCAFIPARRPVRRDAGASQAPGNAAGGRARPPPQGRVSRPLGASATLADAKASPGASCRNLRRRHWRHGSRQACRGNGKRDRMGSGIPMGCTSSVSGLWGRNSVLSDLAVVCRWRDRSSAKPRGWVRMDRWPGDFRRCWAVVELSHRTVGPTAPSRGPLQLELVQALAVVGQRHQVPLTGPPCRGRAARIR